MAAVVITLTEDDLIRLKEVLMDADEKGALEFLRQVIGPEVEKRQKGKCEPPV
jgi:hypothetical protein